MKVTGRVSAGLPGCPSPLRNAPFLGGAALALVLGLWAGLSRLTPLVEAAFPHQPAAHGPLMVSGFLGALIGLERAVALGSGWAFGVPALAILGTVSLLIVPETAAPGGFLVTAGLLAVAVSVALFQRRRNLAQTTMGLGSLAWLLGNSVWALGWPTQAAVPWWGAFLIGTIAGERLELASILAPPPSARRIFQAVLVLLGLGLGVLPLDDGLGGRILGLGTLGLALWLLRWDLARRTIRRSGQLRFVAGCLIGGYCWLLVAGVLLIVSGSPSAWVYDAVVHAVFLGFVFSMIFGHAPIVAKAVLRVDVPYSPLFYGHLALLHASLVARIVGDLAGSWGLRLAGGFLGAGAIGVFLLMTVLSVLRGRIRSAGAGGPRAEG